MNTPTILTGLGFVLVTVVYFFLFLRLFSRAVAVSGWAPERQSRFRRNLTLAFAGWAALLIVLGMSGFAGNFDLFPANTAPILALPMISILIFVFSSGTKDLLKIIPESDLIRLQTFRFFVELLLWALFLQNLAPIQMTFEGRNFDILVALTAPFAAWLFAGKKWALVTWNVLGLCLLANIVTIALLSLPTPFRVFDNEPANTIVLKAPFILLPGMLVPLAYGLHFLSLRQLLTRERSVRVAVV